MIWALYCLLASGRNTAGKSRMMMDLDSQMRQVMEEKDDVLSTFITPFQMINYTVLQIRECNNKQPY